LHMECIYPVLYMYHIFCIIHIIQTIYVTYLIRNICSYWRAYAYMPTSTSIVPLQWVSLTGSVHTQKTLFKYRSLVVYTDISSNLFFCVDVSFDKPAVRLRHVSRRTSRSDPPHKHTYTHTNTHKHTHICTHAHLTHTHIHTHKHTPATRLRQF